MKKYNNIFEKIVSLENLFSAWDKFKDGKRKKKDVLKFEYNLEKNICGLRNELKIGTYKHGAYSSFYINDSKQRHIHKAQVRDRIVHQAVFSVLYPIFENTFIYDSYSSRIDKGTHRGFNRLRQMLRKASKNNTQNCFILKCDIKKFFASIDREILIHLISKEIKDDNAIRLIKEIIGSFSPGIPLGNLTSQIFSNIYLNELDQFIKQQLKIPFYIRYADDFVIVDISMEKLESLLNQIGKFLEENLKLKLHPHKVVFCKYHKGIDFLGYVQFPHHRILRQKTKRRILKKIKVGIKEQALQSYLGVLSHADHFELSEEIKNLFWLNSKK